MVEADWTKFDWVQQQYEGIYEIYPRRCMNSRILDSVLRSMCSHNYRLVKIHDGWIRAFKQN